MLVVVLLEVRRLLLLLLLPREAKGFRVQMLEVVRTGYQRPAR